MVILRTLGECIIEVGATRYGPGSPHLFGLLLFLAMNRGRTVPRGTLHATFFPEASEANAGHSLRQLVYRLRSSGAPIETESSGLRLAADQVADDFTVLFEPAADLRADVMRAAGTFLPGYAPRLSAAFAAWVDEQRGHVHGRIRRTLLSELAGHREAGRWEAVERTAQTLLAIDPLHEEATLSIAEAMAVTGNKIAAVRVLDRYIQEAGPGAEGVKLPAQVLRRRIAERLPAVEYDTNRAPFVGRAEELQLFQRLLGEVRGGGCRTSIVWGEAGIGKTRLVAEFCKAAVIGGASVARSVSQPHDERRPMGAFLDLTPALLKLPGALGASPEAMRYLQRLVRFDPQQDEPVSPEHRDPEYLSACITRALSELLDAITSEVPLVLVVEDVQWLDRVSRLVLADLLAERKERRLLLIATWRATEDPLAGSLLPERTRSIRLRGLAAEDAARLMTHQLRESAVPFGDDVMAWGIRTAQGNPFFLHELARHYAVHRSIERAPASLLALLRARLDRVPVKAIQFLQAAVVLGAHATADRVAAMLELRPGELLEAVDTLEDRSLLQGTGTGIAPTHPLLAELAMERCAPEARRLLHERAAGVLSRSSCPQVRLAAANHHTLAKRPAEAVSVILEVTAPYLDVGPQQLALELLTRAVEQLPVEDVSPAAFVLLVRLADLQGDRLAVLKYGARALAVARGDFTDQIRVAILDARRSLESPTPQLLTECVHLVSATDCDDTRTRAEILTYMLADAYGRRDLALQIYGMLAPPRGMRGELTTAELHAELIFHTSFGEHTRAADIARSYPFCASPRYSDLRTQMNVAITLQRCRHLDEAVGRASWAFEHARNLKLFRAAFDAASLACSIEIDHESLERARYWHELANAHRHHADDADLAAHLINDLILSGCEGQRLRTRAALAQLGSMLDRLPERARIWVAAIEGAIYRAGLIHSTSLGAELDHPLADSIRTDPSLASVAQLLERGIRQV